MNLVVFSLSLGELLRGFSFYEVNVIIINPSCGTGGFKLNLNMAKAVKKKDTKAASNVFHNIIAASVKGNPKPVVKKAAAKKST